MKIFEVGIHHYHPKIIGSHQYYSKSFKAETEKLATLNALKEYKTTLPFLIKGEVIEVTHVRELSAQDLRWVSD